MKSKIRNRIKGYRNTQDEYSLNQPGNSVTPSDFGTAIVKEGEALRALEDVCSFRNEIVGIRNKLEDQNPSPGSENYARVKQLNEVLIMIDS